MTDDNSSQGTEKYFAVGLQCESRDRAASPGRIETGIHSAIRVKASNTSASLAVQDTELTYEHNSVIWLDGNAINAGAGAGEAVC